MEIEAKTKMLSFAAGRLSKLGLKYQIVSKAEDAKCRLGKLDKQKPFHPMDVAANDFMRTKIIWVFFVDQDGRDVGVTCARLEELGDEDVADFWRRSAERLYPGKGYGVRPVGLSGNVIHAGDVFFEKKWREPDGHIRAVMFLLYSIAFLKWQNANAIYAFISDRNMMSSSDTEYATTRRLLVPNIWEDTIDVPLWMVWMPVDEFDRQAESLLEFPNVFDGYKRFIRHSSQSAKQRAPLKTAPP